MMYKARNSSNMALLQICVIFLASVVTVSSLDSVALAAFRSRLKKTLERSNSIF